jgi:site-specific recombinase XerD
MTTRQRERPLGPVLQSYFCRNLIDQRQVSPRTIASYRDTFKLFLAFLESRRGIKADDVQMTDLDAKAVLGFLDDLERTRRNSPRSRNARLAAIRSFIRYATASDPLLLPLAQRVLAIPSKRFERMLVGYLTLQQVQALLDASDVSTPSGFRDSVLITLMYNTGARVSEIAALKICDLQLERSASVRLQGKGRKHRTIPLWPESVRLVRRWLMTRDADPDAALVSNARGNHMTRSGIEHRLRVIVSRATRGEPSLARARVSPHVIRHTTAMHLLQAGVDLSVIAMWLGHESIETTHQYLEADMERKKRALGRLTAPRAQRPRSRSPAKLVAFLDRI